MRPRFTPSFRLGAARGRSSDDASAQTQFIYTVLGTIAEAATNSLIVARAPAPTGLGQAYASDSGGRALASYGVQTAMNAAVWLLLRAPWAAGILQLISSVRLAYDLAAPASSAIPTPATAPAPVLVPPPSPLRPQGIFPRPAPGPATTAR